MAAALAGSLDWLKKGLVPVSCTTRSFYIELHIFTIFFHSNYSNPGSVYSVVSIAIIATLLAPYWFTGNFPGLLATSVVYGVLLVNMLAFITSHVSKYGG